MTENPFEKHKTTINANGRIISLETPRIMSILNITPDSFYDGGKHQTEKEITEHIQSMLEEGADWIDVGAVSTRPGSIAPEYEEERKRLTPVLSILKNSFPKALISVDTFRADIAKMSVEEFGACMINDISSGEIDKNMFSTVGKLNVSYVAMHMKGTPENMQQDTEYNDILNEMVQYFSKKIAEMKSHGITDIIIDPGIGFGKSVTDNFKLLKNLSSLAILECPILVGISRKSMICKTLETKPEHALNGTIAANMLALLNGADILRVHDVKEAAETIKIFNAYIQS